MIDCSFGFGFGSVDCLCYDCAIEFGLVEVKVTEWHFADASPREDGEIEIETAYALGVIGWANAREGNEEAYRRLSFPSCGHFTSLRMRLSGFGNKVSRAGFYANADVTGLVMGSRGTNGFEMDR